MNKAQREVAEYLLDKEERIIKQLERQYKQALADVEMDIRIMLMDEQTPSRIHRVEYQKRLKAQIESTLENLHRNEYKTINQFLQDSYKDSFVGTMYDMHSQGVPVIVPIDANAAVKAIQLDTQLSDRKIHPNANGEHVTLYESLGVDVDNLKETIRLEITRGLATNMQPEYIAQNIANLTKAPLSRAKTIARTESHRIQQASAQDARERAKARGADVFKQWDSTLDGATRKAHRELDGQIVPINKPFTYGNLKAMYPGDFGDPAQDCNCRCVAVQRARWALDEEELEEQKRRAEAFGLGQDEAKKQQFAEYEKKYLKAAQSVEKSGDFGYNSGGIKGAYNDQNDPGSKKRDAHAERYYTALRNSNKDRFVDAVSKNASVDAATVAKVYKHVFEDKHELDKGLAYFDPDYYMAESFRRLRTNDNIQPHDIILLRHEAMEHDIMQANPGMSYDEAHAITSKTYNYKKALLEWLKKEGN